jgi:hypothetical protein
MTTSVEVRGEIVGKLRRDLIGPAPIPDNADLASEVLKEWPSRWYLAGFIAPEEALRASDAAEDEERETEAEAQDDIAGAAEGGSAARADDDPPPEAPTTPRRFTPSSIALTVLVPEHVTEIEAQVSWGDYRTEPPLPKEILVPKDDGEEDGKKRVKAVDVLWMRVPRGPVSVRLPIAEGRNEHIVPDSAPAQGPGGALLLVTHARSYPIDLPGGTVQKLRAVTVFLVNRRQRGARRYQDVSYAFQARLELRCADGFCARHDLSGWQANDSDMRLADLHYRDVAEYGVGRGTSADWRPDEDGMVRAVWTEPLPTAYVERVVPNEDMPDVERDMAKLAALADQGGVALASSLNPMVRRYRTWIEGETAKLAGLGDERRRQIAQDLVKRAALAAGRIEAGIAILADSDDARSAFRLMNLAVEAAARHRNAGRGGDPAAQAPPVWRPFQLAFILLNLPGLCDPTHDDREMADLLFFPTGGGKTEAYLGLAAFTIALRRLKSPGLLGSGVSVIMRYTLRLLTLDQLARAAGVICALERLRMAQENEVNGKKRLGDWPIDIGLWVGSDASPNRLGGTGQTGDDTAVTRVRKYKRGQDKRAPAPLKACPWCNEPFTPNSFHCVPNDKAPLDLELRCVNTTCDFAGQRLPIVTVDDSIYRRLPAFVIATVDKFAALPWVGESGAFFGHVDRHDPARGFFGPMQVGGAKLFNDNVLDPPDLIIQDELHLISGPLGTVAGLYEAAIDQLCTRTRFGTRVRPKIVASTATVRRAGHQIHALFDRAVTQVFPPPGVDRTDSFFAQTDPDPDQARLYVGVAAQGRGPKLIFRQTLTTLTAAAQAAANADLASADPYLTAVCYFNALRELGGARRIVEDEVTRYASNYGSERRRHTPNDQPFADRSLHEPMELTSRVSTDQVAEAKARLEQRFGPGQETVDVALATNMISVGLDIGRLGLMLVSGQPKTTAEYIQATSRVGRENGKPGLVVALLNLHKPRDRAHFEQFRFYHAGFYRAVEATSVTPWARRALDRALAAVVVTIARHLDGDMTPENAAERLAQRPDVQDHVRTTLLARAPESERPMLQAAIDALFQDWIATNTEQTSDGGSFSYAGESLPRRLLVAPLDPRLEGLSPAHQRFVASRSMRDVEPNVVLKILGPDGHKIANAQDVS